MKRIYFLFLLALLPLAAYADAVEIDGIYYNLNAENNTAEVTSNPNKYSGSVVIPSKVTYQNNTYDVTRIAMSAFSGCSDLTSITIPDGVTTIGFSAFSSCSGLTSITIPDGVTTIGQQAFLRCSNLTSITIPNSITNIYGSAFSRCSSLTSITIPDGVTIIDSYSFSGCSGLTSITIPSSVTYIGIDAFENCSSLASVIIDVPSPLTINSSVFTNRANATLYVPAGAKAAYEAADYWKDFKEIVEAGAPSGNIVFANDKVKAACVAKWDTDKDGELSYDEAAAVTSFTNFSAGDSEFSFDEFQYFTGVTSLSNNSFSNRENLTSIILPSSITSIGREAFWGSKITSINLGDLSNLTTIGTQAFYNCYRLTEVTLPASITTMGSNVFANCYNIVKVVSNIAVPLPNSGENNIIAIYNDAVLYVPTGKADLYEAAGWKEIDGEFQSFRVITDGNSTDPVARGGLVYGGSDIWMGGNTQGQRLIYPGAYRDGMMEYSLDGSTYSTSVPLGIDAGEYTVYYRKVGESGVSTLTATIAPKTVSSPTITLSQTSYTYDGTAKEPTVTVKDGETTISPEEYTVGYSNNTNAGTATVTITDKTGGNYTVSGSKTFTINTKTVSSPTITLSQTSYTYDGTAKEPTVTVKDGETTISPEEYTVGYSNNTNVGTATVTITDKEGGNYNVSGSTTFAIVEAGELAKFVYSINPDEITCTITGYTDACTGNVTIPSSVDGRSVTAIGQDAFLNCSALSSISIPNSVTSIGRQAFRGCSNLTSIELPDEVSEIGDLAFYGCSSLSEFTIPSSLKKMGNNYDNCYTFGGCSSLRKITLNKGASFRGKGTSIKNLPIETVIVYNTNPTNPDDNFDNIIRDAATLYVPSGCSAAYKAADGWKNFTNVIEMDADVDYSDVGKTFTVDGINYKVSGINPLEVQVGWLRAGAIDKNYEGSLTIPSSVTGPGGKVYSCTSLGYMSFSSRSGLTSITIPNSVTNINKYAFQSCSGLSTITIPNSVTSIGRDAFSYCSNLSSVTVEVNTPLTITEDVFSNRANATLNVPAGTKTAYQAADYWKEFKEIVEIEQDVSDMLIFSINSDGNTCSVTGHTEACTGNITIPSSVDGRSVTAIGSRAFYGCSSLTSITIPNSVTSIGQQAFWECTNLTSITIPNSVTSIGSSVFYGCTNLTSITIPNSVTSIGYLAFGGCTGLTSITIPNSVTSIGYRAFYGCSSLTSITIPNSVTSIGTSAFYGCASLTSITIPNSVTIIDHCAFQNCTSLTSITIPNSVITIGESTFSGCTSLTSITIPNSVTSIGYLAFSGCI